ncbi:MAG: iron-sulfur cluster loop [Alphaproteobacteria bacterium]|nr:iron-sulfur cluster loop [Alphaproteobacteria bacterium]MDE2631132.1 iron-sulfur cluster loop [Alphaproteobacteria bacterium]
MTDGIRKLLVEKGKEELEAPWRPYPFTKDKDADKLLNDLKHYPHAFVIACICDRQMKAEKAWLVPYLLQQRIGTFEFSSLCALAIENLKHHMGKPTSLHRFTPTTAKNIHSALALIAHRYGGDASGIWKRKPSSAEVVYRFLELRGVGVKIATMAANILARTFKVKFRDYYSIDISPDVHVRRVFTRLGLMREKAPNEELIYRARALSPEFPGLLDSPAFEIGRNWCRPKKRMCGECFMREECPSASAG